MGGVRTEGSCCSPAFGVGVDGVGKPSTGDIGEMGGDDNARLSIIGRLCGVSIAWVLAI